MDKKTACTMIRTHANQIIEAVRDLEDTQDKFWRGILTNKILNQSIVIRGIIDKYESISDQKTDQ